MLLYRDHHKADAQNDLTGDVTTNLLPIIPMDTFARSKGLSFNVLAVWRYRSASHRVSPGITR